MCITKNSLYTLNNSYKQMRSGFYHPQIYASVNTSQVTCFYNTWSSQGPILFSLIGSMSYKFIYTICCKINFYNVVR